MQSAKYTTKFIEVHGFYSPCLATNIDRSTRFPKRPGFRGPSRILFRCSITPCRFRSQQPYYPQAPQQQTISSSPGSRTKPQYQQQDRPHYTSTLLRNTSSPCRQQYQQPVAPQYQQAPQPAAIPASPAARSISLPQAPYLPELSRLTINRQPQYQQPVAQQYQQPDPGTAENTPSNHWRRFHALSSNPTNSTAHSPRSDLSVGLPQALQNCGEAFPAPPPTRALNVGVPQNQGSGHSRANRQPATQRTGQPRYLSSGGGTLLFCKPANLNGVPELPKWRTLWDLKDNPFPPPPPTRLLVGRTDDLKPAKLTARMPHQLQLLQWQVAAPIDEACLGFRGHQSRSGSLLLTQSGRRKPPGYSSGIPTGTSAVSVHTSSGHVAAKSNPGESAISMNRKSAKVAPPWSIGLPTGG